MVESVANEAASPMFPQPSPEDFDDAVARACAILADIDSQLAAIMAEAGPCRLAPVWEREPFESLVRAVIHQQVHARAAEAILGRLIALFAPRTFPTPADIAATDEATLRAAGLSASKMAAVRDVAAKSLSGVVPSRAEADTLSDEALIERLITVRGVGRWTVETLLMFSHGRLDVMPADDLGVRMGMQLMDARETMPTRKEAMIRGERWRPWRSVGSWYMWRAVEAERARRRAITPPSRVRRKQPAPPTEQDTP